ncbi:DUF2634 domain-containing protein [Paenibacillus periandrae]|uniref:DUF2634 domain-containing protein n=1 Tax=Paenibacillus periandrae TaxID=1761741 RepID=UPI001F09974A|nr:DUF2634 domain-containing protein [Paenibacillus periandrae]
MRTLKLTDGDLVFTNGTMQLVDGNEEIAQAVRIELLTFKKEWFLDSRMGVDYYGVILMKQPNYEAIRAELVQAILREPRIRSVDSLDVDFDRAARNLKVTFKATTRSGQAITQQEVLSGA